MSHTSELVGLQGEQTLTKELAHYKYEVNRYADFLEWLFNNDMSHTTQNECWKQFEKQESSEK